ncbi:MAG TPA: hypothetical protein V6C86_08485 [Oculatellaceae cyanobacterium]
MKMATRKPTEPVEIENLERSRAARLLIVAVVLILMSIVFFSQQHATNLNGSPSTGTQGLKIGAEGATMQGHPP